MNLSIKTKIYLSFFLLVSLFAVNGIFTIVHLQKIKRLSTYVTEVLDPSIRQLEDFNKMVIESKMYSSNWVFLRANQKDKEALLRIHNTEFKTLKLNMSGISQQWRNQASKDSLQRAFTDFAAILEAGKKIIGSLKEFKDYDDPVLKLQAELVVEDEIIPRTAALTSLLGNIIGIMRSVRMNEQAALEQSSASIRKTIIVLAAAILFTCLFFSMYMARIIIRPINKIISMVNNLGKGIITTINHKSTHDEIGAMVQSVNHLSEKLQVTADFAHQVGKRNFDMPFKPLSNEDTLGKALISMRDNLRISLERLNEAQRIASLGSWEWDIKTNKVFWSDELFTIFDVSPPDFIPSYQGYLNFVVEDDRERVNAVIMKCLQDGDPFSVETKVMSSDGQVKVLFTQGTRVSENGEVIRMSGIAQDITSRKKAEADLERKNKELERKNKELEQFAYVASHDLQEPLRTTSSFVDLLQKQYKGKIDQAMDKYLTYITQSTDRMKVLIKDLLDYSRIGRKKELSVVDCNVTLEEVMADLGMIIKESRATVQSGRLPVVHGYSTEIKQLFQNLLTNAIKFRKKGEDPVVRIKSWKRDASWEFSFEDNGIGIDPRHNDRIFVIFQRLHTRSEYEGSGIGLSHCKKIVELHGGKIWVDSMPGEGSTFRFTLYEQTA
ncbi:MAG TPA: ATP-binding protein [Chitinophagaceae bacterium]|nr:ATP-binding protein [Chitinophagaceae bacterium]